jgi:hypothetical protein
MFPNSVPELVLRHRLARIARIARAILKASTSLPVMSLVTLPSASGLPISLPAHVAFLLLFY